MSADLNAAAARLLDVLTDGARSAGQALPDMVLLAGRTIQVQAAFSLLSMGIILAAIAGVWVWRHRCARHWDEDAFDLRIMTGMGLGVLTALALLMIAAEAPKLAVRASDPRLAIMSYSLELAAKGRR